MSIFFPQIDMTQQALDNSEVFSSYIKTQAKKDYQDSLKKKAEEEKIKEDNSKLMAELEAKIASDVNFKNKLIAAKRFLVNNPQEVSKVDVNFVKALNMLKLEEK